MSRVSLPDWLPSHTLLTTCEGQLATQRSVAASVSVSLLNTCDIHSLFGLHLAGTAGAPVLSGGLADVPATCRPAGGQGQQRGEHPGVPPGPLPEGCEEAHSQS